MNRPMKSLALAALMAFSAGAQTRIAGQLTCYDDDGGITLREDNVTDISFSSKSRIRVSIYERNDTWIMNENCVLVETYDNWKKITAEEKKMATDSAVYYLSVSTPSGKKQLYNAKADKIGMSGDHYTAYELFYGDKKLKRISVIGDLRLRFSDRQESIKNTTTPSPANNLKPVMSR